MSKNIWKEFYEEFKPRNVGGSISIDRYLGLLKGQKTFFRQKFKEAFEKTEGCKTTDGNYIEMNLKKFNEIKKKYL